MSEQVNAEVFAALDGLPTPKQVQVKVWDLVNEKTMLPFAVNRNVRGADPKTYAADNPDVVALVDNIAAKGTLLDPIVIDSKTTVADGKPDLVRGNRRAVAYAILHKRFPHDLRWHTLRALDYQKLTPEQRVTLHNDHGLESSIGRRGLVNAVLELYTEGKAEMAVLRAERGLFNQIFPPKKPFPKMSDGSVSDEEFTNRRGILQDIKRIGRLPVEASEYAMKRFCREAHADGIIRSWPDSTATRKLLDIFNDECNADPAKFTKRAPGPAFTKAWDEMKSAAATKEANGTTERIKAEGMMDRDQADTAMKASASHSRAEIIAQVLRLSKDAKKSTMHDELLAEVEADPKYAAKFKAILGY